ncbi:MAG TPA: DUF4351 domain-containing protein [Kofleriaceae bacterium]|jgi:hypothetical protein|nr:DUF4351 domain-containing protein [Kofleriaceae bacterium]
MHNRSDQFAKNILRDALSRACASESEVEVLAATQKIDVYSVPDPNRVAERSQLGLLGELSAEPSLFEPFHDTPALAKARRCINKQHTWHHELSRRARAAAGAAAVDADLEESAQPAVAFPALVVISPGRPETVLDAYGCQAVRPGVYHAVWGLVLRVVVLAELPRTRETLLLRLLGAGRLLREALADLAALPDDAWEKTIATPLLVHFQLRNEHATDQEDDMSAEIRAWFEDYQQKLRTEAITEGRKEGVTEGRKEGVTEGRKEGIKEGITEGRKEGIKEGIREGIREGERSLLLRQLHARFGELPEAAVARIEAADMADLERWGERVLGAQTLDEVLDEPS